MSLPYTLYCGNDVRVSKFVQLTVGIHNLKVRTHHLTALFCVICVDLPFVAVQVQYINLL